MCDACNTIKGLGLQVIVSGKLRAARAKSMKFKDGYMISSGSPVNDYIDSAVRHVMLRQVLTDFFDTPMFTPPCAELIFDCFHPCIILNSSIIEVSLFRWLY